MGAVEGDDCEDMKFPSPASGRGARGEGLARPIQFDSSEYSFPMDNCFPHHPEQLPDDIRTWAREMRGNMTDAESLLWQLLRNRRLAGAKFRRQHPVGCYILDFYCHDRKLAIELDGGQHAEETDYDRVRDEWLNSHGIKVMRFWNNQMLLETESVAEAIFQALGSRA